MADNDAKAGGAAQADQALENAATALRRSISAQRRVLREIRQAQEAHKLGMRLHIHHKGQEGHSESSS